MEINLKCDFSELLEAITF